MFPEALLLILLGTLTMAVGGCHCCNACDVCTSEIDSVTADITFPTDTCNSTGCSDISGTYEMLPDEADGCCFSASDTGSCSTDDCDNCGGTDNSGSYCCNADDSEVCRSRQVATDDLLIPTCSADAAGDACNATPGCTANAEMTDPPFVPLCASDPTCSGTFDNYDGMGYIDPGYSCLYPKDCECVGSCDTLNMSITSCIRVRDEGSGNHIFVDTTITDGIRTYESNEDLGAGETIDCATAISSLALTLTEVTSPGVTDLCGQPTVTLTANAA